MTRFPCSLHRPPPSCQATRAGSGLLARQAPREALSLTEKIGSQQWRLQALRSVYRNWAEIDPRSALEGLTGDDDLRADLLLEVALGASASDPRLALELLQQFPQGESTFRAGYCRIAPSLARVEPGRVLSALTPAPSAAISPEAVDALAAVLLEAAGVGPGFYPEVLCPRGAWPLVVLPEPVRFR